MDKLDALLQKTSRTFALSIPLLPDGIREQVACTYLVFRIADTIEDEGVATPTQRINALRQFNDLLHQRDYPALDTELKDWLENHPPDHEGYAELLLEGADVCSYLEEITTRAASIIRTHVSRTIQGMCEHLVSHEPIRDIQGVKAYCYQVAGIVGEVLTELYVCNYPRLEQSKQPLYQLAPSFGEALQLVNILKDETVDGSVGRQFIPGPESREQLLDLADENCQLAGEYIKILQEFNAPAGILRFNFLNLSLAERTLTHLRTQGPGAKITRDEVQQALANCSKFG